MSPQAPLSDHALLDAPQQCPACGSEDVTGRGTPSAYRGCWQCMTMFGYMTQSTENELRARGYTSFVVQRPHDGDLLAKPLATPPGGPTWTVDLAADDAADEDVCSVCGGIGQETLDPARLAPCSPCGGTGRADGQERSL